MNKTAVAISLSLMLVSTLACKKAAMPEAQPTDVLDHVSKAPSTPPVNLVHGAFKVATYTKFEFEVPAHSITPRLEGSFESALATQSAAPSNIDLLIMTRVRRFHSRSFRHVSLLGHGLARSDGCLRVALHARFSPEVFRGLS